MENLNSILNSQKFFGAIAGAVMIIAGIALLTVNNPTAGLKPAGAAVVLAGLISVVWPWVKRSK